jgi:hypothetical protein
MARGWESKSIEAQQDAAQQRTPASRPSIREDAARQNERATLLLARTRALADLQQACAKGHRAMLEQVIAELDKRLSALSAPSADN